jgi:acetyl esterase/lipase
MYRPLLCFSLIVSLFSSATLAEPLASLRGDRGYPPKLPDAKVVTYKTVGETKLDLYIYNPEGHAATDKRPAIVFFFGGGWQNGSPSQFYYQCKYLASRGMVAITADYRVASRQQVKAVSCVSDAKSAIRFVREHAAELGVDPTKIVASGGSAGGHIAGCTGTIKEFDEEGENTAVSSRPNAMVLFNPALALAPIGDAKPAGKREAELAEGMKERAGVDPERLSPAHRVEAGQPPALILIGTEDFLLEGCKKFTEAMKTAGNRCDLDLYEGAGHGFFNPGRGDNKHFVQTLTSADRFLTSLGYLSGEPTVEKYFEK